MKEKEIAKNVLDTFGMSSTPADVEAYMRLVAWCWTALLICGAVWGLYKLISFVLRNHKFEEEEYDPFDEEDSHNQAHKHLNSEIYSDVLGNVAYKY